MELDQAVSTFCLESRTVLGLLLFLLHINEMPSVVNPHTQCGLFADDCLVYRVVDSLADQLQLQQDLAVLEARGGTHSMKVIIYAPPFRPPLFQVSGKFVEFRPLYFSKN